MTRDAYALHAGDRIHITDHDVYDVHVHRDQWVTLTAEPDRRGAIVVLAGLTDAGAWTATAYLLLQPVELEVAA